MGGLKFIYKHMVHEGMKGHLPGELNQKGVLRKLRYLWMEQNIAYFYPAPGLN